MALVFHNTDDMVNHLTNTAKSMMMLPMPLPFTEKKLPEPVDRMVLCVVTGGDENAVLRGDIRVVSILKDVLEPLAEFGHGMNLIRGFSVRFPGMSFSRPLLNQIVPIGGNGGERDDDTTHLGVFHLSKTVKGCSMDENGVCPGDRLVMVVRVKPHLLFGLVASMAVMLGKDIL